MENRKKWTEDDEIYLEYYLYGDVAEGFEKERDFAPAKEFLGRGLHAIRTKASRMRKDNKKTGYINKPYTKEEMEFIKENYQTLPVKNIAERLGRSADSIKIKASKMGVNKHKSIEKYDSEIRELAKKGYWRTAIARELGLKENSVSDYINRRGIDCTCCPKEIQQEYWRREEEIRWAKIKARSK